MKVIRENLSRFVMSQPGPHLSGTAGIDEAGRGPVIGPMVICGVLFQEEVDETLRGLGVRDSKMLTPKRRRSIADQLLKIADRVKYEIVSAKTIDTLRAKGVTLNKIEVNGFVSVLKELRPSKAYVDAADVNADRFGELVCSKSGLEKKGCHVISEHKADSRYPVVSAASILAKEERERRLSIMYEEFGDFGSGYPNDPKTVSFIGEILRRGEDLPLVVRKSWKSIIRIREQVLSVQTTLDKD